MTSDKLNRLWLLATFVLIVITITASLIIWARHDQGRPIEISSPPTSPFQGEIYLAGAIHNPGAYPLMAGDTVEGIIQASGGMDKNADVSRLRLYVPLRGNEKQPQLIDINRAEVWLLQALPDIGQVRAQAIVDYRQKNGPFHSVKEITNVPGISNSIYENIKVFITIAE